MKKFLSLSLVVAGLLVGSLPLRGAETTFTLTAAAITNNLVASNGVYVSQVTVANSTATAMTLALFDTAWTNLTWIRGAYNTFTSYTTNQVLIYTNSVSGMIFTNTNSVNYTLALTKGQATNAFPKLAAIAVPASGTVTYTPLDGITFALGVLATNDQACQVTLTYSSLY